MALDLVIVTPEGEAFSGNVEQVVLPGSEGEFGVLEEHERILAPLQHGAIEIQTDGGTQWAAVSNGFADVAGERVVVLADSCVLSGDIDRAAATTAKSEAEAELASLGDGDENDTRREALGEVIRQSDVPLEVAGKWRAAQAHCLRDAQADLVAFALSLTLPSTSSTRNFTSWAPVFFLIAAACFSITPWSFSGVRPATFWPHDFAASM